MQPAAWQRGPAEGYLLEAIEILRSGKLEIPYVMDNTMPAADRGTPDRPYNADHRPSRFKQSLNDCPAAKKAQINDMSFIMTRSSKDPHLHVSCGLNLMCLVSMQHRMLCLIKAMLSNVDT